MSWKKLIRGKSAKLWEYQPYVLNPIMIIYGNKYIKFLINTTIKWSNYVSYYVFNYVFNYVIRRPRPGLC